MIAISRCSISVWPRN